jgi:deferrochelatase/peroxidase EfeB
VKDPHSHLPTACGTYWVFRKLEQNVAGFKAQEILLDKKGLELGDPGAMAIGRFEDGTPLALRKKESELREPENDFTYGGDPEGNKCPVFGHIRIVNPRRESDKPHRIARRGITYGDPTPPSEAGSELPERGVGLLFQCCQADIANQFEYLQRLANDHDDPLVGQPDSKHRLQLPKVYGKSEKRVPFEFKRFVTLKGGEYFFIPSISFLEDLR